MSGAQPSGGPYGPVPQNYALPDITGIIYYVSPDGEPGSSGKTPEQPARLEEVIKKVVTGDAIVLRGGTYRTGNLELNQGITLQAYQNEHPVLKGTYIADEWQDLGHGLWSTDWEYLFPMKPADWWNLNRAGRTTPLHRFNNDMVFADGRFLQSAGWLGEVDENSYYIDYAHKKVYIGIDPEEHTIEITAFNVALHRTTQKVHGKAPDRKGPTIRGITFTQYAYRAFEFDGTNPDGISDEANHGKEVVGTTLEHCTISFCSRVAGYFRGDSLTVRHCKIHDTSTEGLFILSSSDVLLERNIFARNNIEMIQGYFPAAVKIFNQCYRVTCNDNLVIDQPYSNGIWYDVGNVDGVFTNNWIEGVGFTDYEISRTRLWPSDNGFFFEISKGAVVAGNVFVNCDHGIMVLNSSDVKMYNNTFINSMAAFGRNTRSAEGDHFGWHPSTGPDVDERFGHEFANNLFSSSPDYARPYIFVWQHPDLCRQLERPQLDVLDYNQFIRSSKWMDKDLILYAPAENEKCLAGYRTPESFHKQIRKYSAHDKLYTAEQTPVFRGFELGNFQLLENYPGRNLGCAIPEAVKLLLGTGDEAGNHVGAYP